MKSRAGAAEGTSTSLGSHPSPVIQRTALVRAPSPGRVLLAQAVSQGKHFSLYIVFHVPIAKNEITGLDFFQNRK